MKTRGWIAGMVWWLTSISTATAQNIVPTVDGTGTIVNQQGQSFHITGGKASVDGANLFHSFSEFGLSSGQIANFLANPQLQNILSRINSNNPSFINGLIQVTGGSPNLYLFNPAGIIFGPNASLNVPAAFSASTANNIEFGNGQWWNPGTSDYSQLLGSPQGLQFQGNGVIVNQGNLQVSPGQSLNLSASSVINTGTLQGGTINITTVPGSGNIKITPQGQLLSLEISPPTDAQGQPLPITVDNLPELLTGKQLVAGDVVAKQVLASEQVNINATGNLYLPSSQIEGTGINLKAQGQVIARDSATEPLRVQATEQLNITGVQGIDIWALAHPGQALLGGSSVSLHSQGNISLDAHVYSGGNVLIDAPTFISTYDPIITATGDVVFGNYTGVSLKVESKGSITGGDVSITGPDGELITNDPDGEILKTQPALILKAGLSELVNEPNIPITKGGTTFNPGESSTGGVTLGTVTVPGGPVIIEAKGNVTLQGNVSTNGGDVKVSGASINTKNIIAIADQGGNVELSASGNITTGSIQTSGFEAAGNIKILTTEGNINTTAGTLDSTGNLFGFTDSEMAKGGDITLEATQGEIQLGSLSAFGQFGQPGGSVQLTAAGAITNSSNTSIRLGSQVAGGSFISNPGGDLNIDTPNRVLIQGTVDTGGANLYVGSTKTPTNIAILTPITTSGGNVGLAAGVTIEANTINTQSNPFFLVPKGGDVTINTGGTFKARGSFTAQNGLAASISTSGRSSNGSISITHGGGTTFPPTPFVVGSAEINGTAAAINTGAETISPPQTIFGTFTSPQGTIAIITGNIELPIVAATDGTGSIVTPSDDFLTFNLTGGLLSGDGRNVFHSYSRYDLPERNQTANFVVNSAIQNILARISSGDPSVIMGTIKITSSGSPNLFLLNPAGVVFGPSAQINVPANFTLTTANGVAFGDNWFSASGSFNPAQLNGNPTQLALTTSPSGAIINTAPLNNPNGSINLIGGTVITTDAMSAKGFNIASAENSFVDLENFTVYPVGDIPIVPNPWDGDVLSLSEIVNRAIVEGVESDSIPLPVTIVGDNQLQLADTNVIVNPLDVAVGDVSLITKSIGTGTTNIPSINLTATGTLTVLPLIYQDGSTPGKGLNGGGGNIALIGTEIDLLNNVVSAQGNLSIAAFEANKNIVVGGADNNTTALDITPDDLSKIDPQFNFVTIGGSNSEGTLTVASDLQFSYPLILQSPQGTVQINGNLTGIERGAYSINGLTVNLNGNILTTGNFIEINGSTNLQKDINLATVQNGNVGGGIILSGPIKGNQNLNISAGEGDVELGEIDGINNLLVSSSGATNFNQQVNANTVTTDGVGTTILGADITTNGAQNYQDPVVLSTSVTLTGAPITFNSTLNSRASEGEGIGGNSLNVIAGSGSVIFNGAVGNIRRPGTITVDTSGVTEFKSTVNSSGLITDAGGSTILNDTVTVGNQVFGDPVTVANTNLILNGQSISFGSTVDGLNSGGQSLTINNTGSTEFNGRVGGNQPLANLTTDAEGITVINTNLVNTTGNQNYQDLVLANQNTSLLAGGDFTSTDIYGSGSDLTIEADTITTGIIDTSSSFEGGNVTLRAPGDIQVASINTQTQTYSYDGDFYTLDYSFDGELQEFIQGPGGTVDITTGRFFRATDTFIDQNNVLASISTADGGQGGAITIRHGGNGITPFDVGDPATNGTEGALTTGSVTIAPFESFLYTTTRGNISIISVDQPILPPSVRLPIPAFEYDSNRVTALNTGGALAEFPNLNINDAKEILKRIEQETGVKPALIYVSFVPTEVRLDLEKSFDGLESNNTADYEKLLNIVKRASPHISVPPSDDDELELLMVTGEGNPLLVQVSEATRKKVLERAAMLYDEVSNLGNRYLEPASQMYQWIMEPIQEELKARQVENLLFVMPAGLRLIPVAAFYDQKNQQYLAQQYSVGMTPSLSLTDTRYRNIKNSPVLAMGASEFAPNQAQSNLPAVGIELPLIAGQIRSGQFLINQQFTLDNLRSIRSNNPYAIVHLSTHADFQSEDPDKIYIQLYNEKLDLPQLRQLSLNNPIVELLVISACRSAYGDEQAELGFGGLAAQVGVKSVMGSLWYVGDTGTLALMTDFYDKLGEARIKAEALQESQIDMIEGRIRKQEGELINSTSTRGPIPLPPESAAGAEDLSHPFYWASFVMIGSPW